jgi:hypothetical protein
MKEIKNNKEHAEFFKGKRVYALEEAGVPRGWVVNPDAPEELWDISKTAVIPVSPREGFRSQFSLSARTAKKFLSELRQKYQDNVYMTVILDKESQTGWSFAPILGGDIKKPVEDIIKDYALAKESEDNILATMKRQIFLIKTGFR